MPAVWFRLDDPHMNDIDQYPDPYLAMEAMRQPPKYRPPAPPKRTVDPGEMKRIRRRGKAGEYEVVKAFKAHGWPDAFRTPGSGAWRPYGAQDTSPFPLDVASGWPAGYPEDRRSPMAGPWIVEVKFDERMAKAGRGIIGEAFIRATLKKVDQQWRQYVDVPGARKIQPALWGRASNQQWRVFVRTAAVLEWVGSATVRPELQWLEVPADTFFDLSHHVAQSV